jgi:hypothetical protein
VQVGRLAGKMGEGAWSQIRQQQKRRTGLFQYASLPNMSLYMYVYYLIVKVGYVVAVAAGVGERTYLRVMIDLDSRGPTELFQHFRL